MRFLKGIVECFTGVEAKKKAMLLREKARLEIEKNREERKKEDVSKEETRINQIEKELGTINFDNFIIDVSPGYVHAASFLCGNFFPVVVQKMSEIVAPNIFWMAHHKGKNLRFSDLTSVTFSVTRGAFRAYERVLNGEGVEVVMASDEFDNSKKIIAKDVYDIGLGYEADKDWHVAHELLLRGMDGIATLLVEAATVGKDEADLKRKVGAKESISCMETILG